MAFFSFFDGGFAQILSQIASITVKKLRNTNFIPSRHVKRENTSLPVDVRRSKKSLLKLPIGQCFSPLPKTVPEVFAKVSSAQFFSRFLRGECLMKFRLL